MIGTKPLGNDQLPAQFIKYFIDASATTRFAKRMENTTDPLLESFARVLRQRRLAAGLSQEELAHRAGLSMRYVSLLESRKHMPSLDTMVGLARGLGPTLTELVSEAEARVRDGSGTRPPQI